MIHHVSMIIHITINRSVIDIRQMSMASGGTSSQVHQLGPRRSVAFLFLLSTPIAKGLEPKHFLFCKIGFKRFFLWVHLAAFHTVATSVDVPIGRRF